MGLLSKSFIQRVKAETDLLALVSEYTDVVPAGNNLWMAHCPHPDHHDSTPSFRICHNADGSWSWYCGGCHMGAKDMKSKHHRNYGSDCFAFVSWMSDYKGSKHKIGWREAVEILAKRAGIPMEVDKYDKVYLLMRNIAKKRHKDLRQDEEAISYLHQRGLTDETIEQWMLGVSEGTEFRHTVKRISFPLFSRYNRVVGESARAIHWNKDSFWPKYRNSSNSNLFHKGSYFYGLHLYDSNLPELRITEGAMDVVLASQFGALNVVGTLGTAFTKEHVTILKAMNVTPCFCLDGDAAGQKGMRRAVDMLSEAGIYAKVCILPDGKDLADLALELQDKLEEYIETNAMMYWQYLLEEPLKAFDAQLVQLRAKLMPEIMKASKGATSPNDRILMKSFVKERFGITL